MQPTFAGQDGPVGSVVVGIRGALSPAPGFPLWGIVHCDTYCCAMQMLLISRRGAIHPLAGLHVACWHTSEACLSYDIPEHALTLPVLPLPNDVTAANPHWEELRSSHKPWLTYIIYLHLQSGSAHVAACKYKVPWQTSYKLMMAANEPLLQQVAVHGMPTLVMLPCARRVKVIRWGDPPAQHRVGATMKPCPL